MTAAAIDLSRALEITGWMEPDELQWLAEQAQQAQRIVEVGCFRGRSTRVLADHCPGVVTAVDHWLPSTERADLASDVLYREGPERVFEEWRCNVAEHLGSGRVQFVRMPSLAASARAARTGVFDGSDLVFLDADHSYLGCLADIQAYERFVRPGGLLAGHDYTTEVHPGVRWAVDERFGDQARQGPGSIWWVRL